MAGTVLVKTGDGVCTLTLNRPERLNALNEEMLNDLCAALEQANRDEEVGAIVLRGAGSSFCSGDDLKEYESQSKNKEVAKAYIELIQNVSRYLVLGDKVVVGALHGWAVGGGLEWAINCDFAVFAEDTKCFFPESKWGMFPTGGVTTLLTRMVGLVKARDLMMLGTQFSANEALQMGLAWKVVPNQEVFEVANQLAVTIAGLPRTVVTDLKRAINRAGYMDVEGALKVETDATVQTFLDPDTAIRVGSFGKKN